jgi:hypothetical protein
VEAFRIDRFGSVDGIVAALERGPSAPTEGGSDAGARELAQLPRSDGPQRRRSRSNQARCELTDGRGVDCVVEIGGRGPSRRR